MLIYNQVSILEYPELVGSARYGVKVSPESFSANKLIVVERLFDDLGEYSFVGLSFEGVKLGMRRHLTSNKEYSYVSVIGNETEDDELSIICNVFEIEEPEIIEFDDCW